jgi:hypothetical protein
VTRAQQHKIVLTLDERGVLGSLAAQSRGARVIAFRAKIVLRCAEGGSDIGVAAALRTKRLTGGQVATVGLIHYALG